MIALNWFINRPSDRTMDLSITVTSYERMDFLNYR